VSKVVRRESGEARRRDRPSVGHMSTALVGEIAVWRAANGIDPQTPRPSGGNQLETLPALWKQRLDRDIARATYPATDAPGEERQAARTALSPRDDRQRPYQGPGQRALSRGTVGGSRLVRAAGEKHGIGCVRLRPAGFGHGRLARDAHQYRSDVGATMKHDWYSFAAAKI
jgi:hypothetical protein